jgi:hypothetical protein
VCVCERERESVCVCLCMCTVLTAYIISIPLILNIVFRQISKDTHHVITQAHLSKICKFYLKLFFISHNIYLTTKNKFQSSIAVQ